MICFEKDNGMNAYVELINFYFGDLLWENISFLRIYGFGAIGRQTDFLNLYKFDMKSKKQICDIHFLDFMQSVKKSTFHLEVCHSVGRTGDENFIWDFYENMKTAGHKSLDKFAVIIYKGIIESGNKECMKKCWLGIEPG